MVTVDGKVIGIVPLQLIRRVRSTLGMKVIYRKYIYLLMNKPAGVVSATFDNYDAVVDLLG